MWKHLLHRTGYQSERQRCARGRYRSPYLHNTDNSQPNCTNESVNKGMGRAGWRNVLPRTMFSERTFYQHITPGSSSLHSPLDASRLFILLHKLNTSCVPLWWHNVASLLLYIKTELAFLSLPAVFSLSLSDSLLLSPWLLSERCFPCGAARAWLLHHCLIR